jgi:hypothetical protein
VALGPDLAALVRDALKVRPSTLFSVPATWRTQEPADSGLVGAFRAPVAAGGQIHIFCAFYDLADAVLDGGDLGPGTALEFVAVVPDPVTDRRLIRLQQRQSEAYIGRDDPATPIRMERVQPAELSTGDQPAWSPPPVSWPSSSGEPLIFLGAAGLPPWRRQPQTRLGSAYVFAAKDASIVQVLYREDGV